MANKRSRVALMVETSSIYGREILEGIAEYVQSHQPWSIFVEQRELGVKPPAWLTRRRWDGVISRFTTPRLARVFQAMKVPVVDLNDGGASYGFPSIRSNDAAIGKLAAEHLIERGFRNFGFCGFFGYSWSTERKDGFTKTLASHGFSCALYESYWQGTKAVPWDVDQENLAQFLKSQPRPLGVMASNDVRGQHVLEACSQVQLASPGEVAVIGVDNEPLLCKLCDPPLSTVVPNARRIGFESAELLQCLMSGKRPREQKRIDPVGIETRRSTDTLAIEDVEVAAALRYIRANACQGITAADVLRHVPISRSLLEQRFKQCVQRTLHAEIRQTQLNHAKQLLRDTDLPHKKVAKMSGFSRNEYLSYFFTKSCGQTPRQYRRSQRSGQAIRES